MNSKSHWIKLGNLFIAILVFLTPLLATNILVKTIFKSDLTQFNLWLVDEVEYWHEINTFRSAGFDGGYYSIQELVAPSTFFRFGAHGPVFPVFMGLLARIFGWSQISGPLYNIAFISLGLLLFMLITRPDLKRKIFLLFTILLLYPILFYIPSSMQESLNQMLAFIIGGVLIRLSSTKRVPPVIPAIGILVVIFASFLRINWAIVLFPLVYLMRPQKGKRWFFFSTGIALILLLVHSFLYMYWTSPSPGSFFYVLAHLEPNTPKNMIVYFINNTLMNCQNFILQAGDIPGLPLAILQRYLIIFLSLAMVYFIYKKKTQFIIPLFILVSEVLAAIFLNYVTGGDLRHFAPFVIIAFLFLIENVQSKEVAITVYLSLILSILFFLSFIKQYQNNVGLHFDSNLAQSEKAAPSPALASIKYSEEIDPWCNSLLTDIVWTPQLLSVPAGIGVNYIYDENQVTLPIHSHYLYVTADKIERFLLTGKVETILTEGNRALYIQLHDGCYK